MYLALGETCKRWCEGRIGTVTVHHDAKDEVTKFPYVIVLMLTSLMKNTKQATEVHVLEG